MLSEDGYAKFGDESRESETGSDSTVIEQDLSTIISSLLVVLGVVARVASIEDVSASGPPSGPCVQKCDRISDNSVSAGSETTAAAGLVSARSCVCFRFRATRAFREWETGRGGSRVCPGSYMTARYQWILWVAMGESMKHERREVLLIDRDDNIFLCEQVNFRGPLTHTFISVLWATNRMSYEQTA